MGGAVATTAIAGIEMIKAGSNSLEGLPLADRDVSGMVAYRDLEFGGWDLTEDTLGACALRHGVIDEKELANGAAMLNDMRPWKAAGSTGYCAQYRRWQQARQRPPCGSGADPGRPAAFPHDQGARRVVVVNLASTERVPNAEDAALQSREAFERGLDEDDAAISPAMLYAYAAIDSGTPYANFTPSVAADIAPLADFAAERNVPVAGKDGKTGQTFMKTVIAPALRDRALHVDGWFSTNILGNSDGLALDDPKSLASKLATKRSVLDDILGYPVEDHIIMIHYYRPRGRPDKEAWDSIDLTGFIGQKMQLKLNFLCKDSIPRRTTRDRDRALPRPGAAARRGRRAGADGTVLQIAADERRTSADSCSPRATGDPRSLAGRRGGVSDAALPAAGPPPAALAFLRELGDLKRIHSAQASGSIAERLFALGWAALRRGEAPAR